MVCLEKSWMIKFFWECFLTSFIFHHKEEWEWRSLYLVLLRCLILFWAHSTTLKKPPKIRRFLMNFIIFARVNNEGTVMAKKCDTLIVSILHTFNGVFFRQDCTIRSYLSWCCCDRKSCFCILRTLSSWFQMAISYKLHISNCSWYNQGLE